MTYEPTRRITLRMMCTACEMVGVDRGVAGGAGGEEQRLVALGDVELHRELPGGWFCAASDDGIAARQQLALALRPDHRVHLALDDLAGHRLQRELHLVAGLHRVQLVLVVERDHLAVGLDAAS